MKKWLLLCILPLVVAGCNTVAGMGKDIEKAGEVVQDSAK
jgi:predicted small secreted protein